MSALPQLREYINITPTPEAVEEVANWLRRRYPKHSDRNPLNWYDAFLVLEVSEITIRGYVEDGILKDLTIPSIAMFIARRDIVWDRFGRPEENNTYEHKQNMREMLHELNYYREINGKNPITLEEKIESLRSNLFSPEEVKPHGKIEREKNVVSFEMYYVVSVDQKTFDFINEVLAGDKE
ncbi:MAG: hypothetical protein ABXS91_08555 [Sulfurimonas sp.]